MIQKLLRKWPRLALAQRSLHRTRRQLPMPALVTEHADVLLTEVKLISNGKGSSSGCDGTGSDN